jgi:hypothetical protein
MNHNRGAIYLLMGEIFYSSNYGNTFNLYKELEKKLLVFIKPNSNKLYAATKYKIYEIIIHNCVIKSLPIIDELAFYPLSW